MAWFSESSSRRVHHRRKQRIPALCDGGRSEARASLFSSVKNVHVSATRRERIIRQRPSPPDPASELNASI